jgi:hypothetical protein
MHYGNKMIVDGPARAAVIKKPWRRGSPLAGLETRIGLVNDIAASLTPHETVVAVTFPNGFQ